MKDKPHELTLEILDEAIRQLPQVRYPKIVKVSYNDYKRFREACDLLKIIPEQPQGYTLGFCGEWIIPDKDIPDNHYEIEW